MGRRPKGRPTKYNDKVAELICMGISDGMSLRRVCQDEGMPDKATVFRWLIAHDSFRDQYARAKQQGAEAWAEEIMDIADDGSNDWMESTHPKNPGYDYNGEAVQRSKLRVDTRKWLMSKLQPKKYGEHMDLTSDGEKIQIAPIYQGGSLDDKQPTDSTD